MIKVLAITLILLAVVAGIVGPQLFFVVDEKQLAIVTRFGQVRQSIRSPGLYVKTPFIDTGDLLRQAPPHIRLPRRVRS